MDCEKVCSLSVKRGGDQLEAESSFILLFELTKGKKQSSRGLLYTSRRGF